MYIAVLCSGRMQISRIKESIAHFQALRASLAPHTVMFFFSLNADITSAAYVSEFCAALEIPETECVRIIRNEYPPEIFTLRRSRCSRYENVWSMYTHNQGAFRLMEAYEQAHALRFDVVVKYRTDIVCDTPLPLPSPLDEGVLYIPAGADWGGLNDQIALGSRETMRVYCNCVDAIIPMCTDEGVIWNPEILLCAYVQRVQLPVERFVFPYKLHRNRH